MKQESIGYWKEIICLLKDQVTGLLNKEFKIGLKDDT